MIKIHLTAQLVILNCFVLFSLLHIYSDCRKTLVGASIARLCPVALQKTVPENALLRQAGGRPMVAPTFSI